MKSNTYTAENILLSAIDANLTTHQIGKLFNGMIERIGQPLSEQSVLNDLKELLTSVTKLKEGSDIGSLVHVTMLSTEYRLSEAIENIKENLLP